MIPHEEFTARLKNFCISLGFRQVKISSSGSIGTIFAGSSVNPEGFATDAVLILSCRVSYNPNWGGYSGLPQLLVRERMDNSAEQCPARFIAPFLQEYRFAKDHIFLTETEQGGHLITLPESLLGKDRKKDGVKLIMQLDKIAEPDRNGAFVPVMISGTMSSYALSSSLRQTLDAVKYAWKPGRSIPIDTYLTSELFSFVDTLQAIDQNSPFCATLLPHLRRIVTHRTPNLRAAELHLRQEFSRAVEIFTADHRASYGNMLCLVGLDIDMAAFMGHEDHFFVPWKAYLERIGEDSGDGALDQDDLFVRLMQQEKQCTV